MLLCSFASFGAVYLCRHVLDDMMLGDYAVKKVGPTSSLAKPISCFHRETPKMHEGLCYNARSTIEQVVGEA